MKKEELKAFLKDRGIKGYSSKKKGVFEKKVSEIKEKEASEDYQRKLRDRVLCSACLEQRIQRKIDKYEHAQRLVGSLERTLVCEYCRHPNFAYDGDWSDDTDENPPRRFA